MRPLLLWRNVSRPSRWSSHCYPVRALPGTLVCRRWTEAGERPRAGVQQKKCIAGMGLRRPAGASRSGGVRLGAIRAERGRRGGRCRARTRRPRPGHGRAGRAWSGCARCSRALSGSAAAFLLGAGPRQKSSISRRVMAGASRVSPAATARTAPVNCSRVPSLSRKPLAPSRADYLRRPGPQHDRVHRPGHAARL